MEEAQPVCACLLLSTAWLTLGNIVSSDIHITHVNNVEGEQVLATQKFRESQPSKQAFLQF